MNVAISAMRTKDIRINRHELVTSLQDMGHEVFYIGQHSKNKIHSDYNKLNVKFLSIPIHITNTNTLKEINSILKVIKKLRENNIKALIIYGIRTFPTMVIAAKLAGVNKILCIVNGSGRLFHLKGLKGSLVKFISYPMLRLALGLSNNILFQNKDDIKLLQSKKLLRKENYDLINGSGVNLEEFNTSAIPKSPVFCMIARITANKGVNEYIKAALSIKEKYPNTIFYLIGPLDEMSSSIDGELLQNAIEQKSIIYIGEVEDVKPYLNNCRIFVFPSYHEGMPRAILEAMAIGRAILTTDAVGCRDTVMEGINGFKVPVKNVETLIEKMIWMIEHPEEVETMGNASRKLCEEKYDVHKVNEKIINTVML